MVTGDSITAGTFLVSVVVVVAVELTELEVAELGMHERVDENEPVLTPPPPPPLSAEETVCEFLDDEDELMDDVDEPAAACML